MKKRIVLCADDYGQAMSISRGILELVGQGRLSAVSCMVNAPQWREQAPLLRPYNDQIDIGLHFNLTEGPALSDAYIQAFGPTFSSLSQIMKRAFLRRFPQAVVEAECHAQLDSFEQAMGRLPDYVDGHQHVHQFPVIRAALIAVYRQRFPAKQAYIRLVNTAILSGAWRDAFKKAIIYATGVSALKHLLDKNGIPYNASFSGIYSFDQAQQYPQLFNDFLHSVTDKGIIMCHPGLPDTVANDPIAAARGAEFAYLNSPGFLTDCQAQAVVLSRFVSFGG